MRRYIDLIERTCQTPGAIYNTDISDHTIGIEVTLPKQVHVGDMSDEDGQRFDDMLHDAMERIVAKIVAQTNADADDLWRKARKADVVEGRKKIVPPYPTLESVEEFAKSLHVSLTVHESHHHISLAWIEGLLDRMFAKKHDGARVMEALCSYADYSKSSISLEVLLGDPWLVNYYKRFGFEIDPEDEKLLASGNWAEGGEGDNGPGPYMERDPR